MSVLRGDSRQRRRHAAELDAEANLILDTVAKMIAYALETRRFVLRTPVAAEFRKVRGGSTGVEIVVHLEDPSHADAARALLVERFPDPMSDVIVS
jgi:hypothetical protein